MANDLVEAVINTLEASSVVTTSFGSTWNQANQTGIAKFFTDYSDQITSSTYPYAVITEIGETYEYMTAMNGSTSFIAKGQLRFDIYATARYAARSYGFVIGKALNDAAITWPQENSLLEFRMMQASFMPVVADSGVGSPTVFHRVLMFEYFYSWTL